MAMITRLFLLLVLAVVVSAGLHAQIPRTISYQGILTNGEGTPIANGAHTLRISFYYTATGGDPIHSENHPVSTVEGLFSLVLGQGAGLPSGLDFNEPYWMGISVDGAGELVPRTPLTAAPYALNAERAESLSPDATGVVTGINGSDGAITLQGGGGTTVTRDGNTITISSSGGGSGNGIQGVQNTDGALTIRNPNGPVATVDVADGGIIAVKLGDGSVTTAKLGDGSVTTAKLGDGSVMEAKLGDGSVKTAKLGDGSVTPVKINSNGAAAGQVLKFTGKAVVWGNDEGLLLPYTDTVNSSTPVFYIANTGTGNAGRFSMIGETSRAQDALIATHDGSGDAFYALTTGSGRAGYFQVNDTGSRTAAVYMLTNGEGAAFVANSTKTPPIRSAYDIAIFQHASQNVARINTDGKAFFNGGTQNSGADLAEAFDVIGERHEYEPGDVLVIAVSGDRAVEKSGKPYSTLVAGVYATKPGVLLTEESIDSDLGDKVPMGVVGVIPTKVCDEGGEIRRGDFLVTSSRPGYAMKGDPDKVKVGTVIGKALEEFDGEGEGLIKVLVNVK